MTNYIDIDIFNVAKKFEEKLKSDLNGNINKKGDLLIHLEDIVSKLTEEIRS